MVEKKSAWKSDTVRLIVEGIFLVGILALGLAARVYHLDYAGDSAAYYDAAKVAEGAEIPWIKHGAAYMYVHLLRILFVLIGNKWIAGIWLQIVLQFLACIIWYMAARKICGVIPGIVLAGLIMLAPTEIIRGLTYCPDVLYIAMYGLGLLWIACLAERHSKVKSFGDVLYLLLGAAWFGWVCYLDITGVSLLVLTPCVVLFKKLQKTGAAKKAAKKSMQSTEQMKEEITEEIPEEMKEASAAHEQVAQESNQAIEEIHKEPAAQELQAAPRKVQLIENPLPLPKKHEKKVMDYAFIPDESMMQYDIEVDDNDDYDR